MRGDEMSTTIFLADLPSPLGDLLLVSDEQGRVRALQFAERRARLRRHLDEHYEGHELVRATPPEAIAAALRRYFDGDLEALDRVDVAAAGTPAQQLAWSAMRRLPAGRAMTYEALGRAMGIADWRAAIDAGAAAGANPVAIVVPCHRVVSANGELKGYAWGLHRKRWLLEHEGALAPLVAVPRTASLF
jgi:methylated-DNA-[protein]-cysteine S-methyltransferase